MIQFVFMLYEFWVFWDFKSIRVKLSIVIMLSAKHIVIMLSTLTASKKYQFL